MTISDMPLSGLQSSMMNIDASATTVTRSPQHTACFKPAPKVRMFFILHWVSSVFILLNNAPRMPPMTPIMKYMLNAATVQWSSVKVPNEKRPSKVKLLSKAIVTMERDTRLDDAEINASTY